MEVTGRIRSELKATEHGLVRVVSDCVLMDPSEMLEEKGVHLQWNKTQTPEENIYNIRRDHVLDLVKKDGFNHVGYTLELYLEPTPEAKLRYRAEEQIQGEMPNLLFTATFAPDFDSVVGDMKQIATDRGFSLDSFLKPDRGIGPFEIENGILKASGLHIYNILGLHSFKLIAESLAPINLTEAEISELGGSGSEESVVLPRSEEDMIIMGNIINRQYHIKVIQLGIPSNFGMSDPDNPTKTVNPKQLEEGIFIFSALNDPDIAGLKVTSSMIRPDGKVEWEYLSEDATNITHPLPKDPYWIMMLRNIIAGVNKTSEIGMPVPDLEKFQRSEINLTDEIQAYMDKEGYTDPKEIPIEKFSELLGINNLPVSDELKNLMKDTISTIGDDSQDMFEKESKMVDLMESMFSENPDLLPKVKNSLKYWELIEKMFENQGKTIPDFPETYISSKPVSNTLH